MKYTLAVFDMDGTVLDTLEDLMDATNYALRAFGYPERTLAEIRRAVGNGVYNQIRRSLPADCGEEIVNEVIPVYKEYYTAHMNVKTKPYPGILELMKALRERGVRVGISSNKFDPAVKALCREYFDGLVDFSEGEAPDTPKKPDPTGTIKIIRAAGATKEETIYCGDSPVDVETARNAGVDGIFVTWGFRTREQLEEAGATRFADTTEELLRLVTE